MSPVGTSVPTASGVQPAMAKRRGGTTSLSRHSLSSVNGMRFGPEPDRRRTVHGLVAVEPLLE